MRIELTSIHVDDQDKALAFYTEMLGFVLQTASPSGYLSLQKALG